MNKIAILELNRPKRAINNSDRHEHTDEQFKIRRAINCESSRKNLTSARSNSPVTSVFLMLQVFCEKSLRLARFDKLLKLCKERNIAGISGQPDKPQDKFSL